MFATNKEVKMPWLTSYGKVPAKLEYPQTTLYEEFEKTAKKYPNYTAYDFFGKKTTYSKAVNDIHECAQAFKSIGLKVGDNVTICLPNCPQSITAFYAVNMVGAVANMIHPLSSQKEIEFYLNDSKSVMAVTLDQFYPNFEAIKHSVAPFTLIVTSVKDTLPTIKAIGYALTAGKKAPKVVKEKATFLWTDFLKSASNSIGNVKEKRDTKEAAVVLYSGGTTGVSKGIMLSNLNFNALGMQILEMDGSFKAGDKMLAVIPMFHGFGLGVSIHAMIVGGGCCILVPRFAVESYAKLIKTKKPNYIAGVPSLFEALLRLPSFGNANLSHLKGVFAGGDSLSPSLKERFDTFLQEHNCSVKIREGYGTTECVTASCLTPYNKEKVGSIGIPLPDMLYKIVQVGTTKEVSYGTDGEICISGPTLMMEYVNQPEETAKTLQVHKDNHTWLHTGDLGTMDDEGFVYFKQRIKRIIITNGYNVYPNMIENALDSHVTVHLSCVIGIKDDLKGQKVKAFVVLKDGYEESDELKKTLLDHCREYVAKYALPYDIEFRKELPKTKVGKVAYRELEEEENK